MQFTVVFTPPTELINPDFNSVCPVKIFQIASNDMNKLQILKNYGGIDLKLL